MKKSGATKSGHRACFIIKLYRLVNDHSNSSIVSRTADKNAFLIKQPLLFENKVLPIYFNHSKMSSFERQMNFYGYVNRLEFQPTHFPYKYQI